MRILVEIDKSLYNNILQWCNENDINPVKYIEKTLRERLAIDKYGDLNEKLRKFVVPESKTVVELPVDNTTREPISEPKTRIVPQEPSIDEHAEELNDVSESSGFTKVMEDIDNEDKPKKKRILKTK